MEPRVQYAKTADGVSIAYCEAGEGPNVVRVPPVPWSHVQREWETFPYLLSVKALAETCRIAWYDSRGSGLSDRDALDFSINSLVRDLEAVLGKVAGEKFALCAVWDGVPIAVTYAAARPERVTHLVLVDGYSKGTDYFESPAGQMEKGIRQKDWALYTDTMARVLYRYNDPNLVERFAEHLRACTEPEALRAAWDAVNAEWDITDLLPSITTPTLVLHNQHGMWLPVRAGQRLAAAIPDARFLVVDDMTYQQVPRLIAEFLGLPLTAAAEQQERLPQGTAVILFADIADSTALTERLGDAAFRQKARLLDQGLRHAIRDAGGTPIEGKLLGDGVLAVFTSARQAIEAALRCNSGGLDAGLPLHLGIHAGDVIREGDNVYGGAVNLAARIASASAPGEILVSDIVRGLARTSAGVAFENRGEQMLKGIAEPQRLFAVRPRQ